MLRSHCPAWRHAPPAQRRSSGSRSPLSGDPDGSIEAAGFGRLPETKRTRGEEPGGLTNQPSRKVRKGDETLETCVGDGFHHLGLSDLSYSFDLQTT